MQIASIGEPGVWQDCILALDAWTNGFEVGVFSAPFERGVGGHGSAKTKDKLLLRDRVYDRAVVLANRKYNRRLVHDVVVKRNEKLVTRTSTKLPKFEV